MLFLAQPSLPKMEEGRWQIGNSSPGWQRLSTGFTTGLTDSYIKMCFIFYFSRPVKMACFKL